MLLGESTYNLSGKISDFQSLMAGSSLVMYRLVIKEVGI